MKKYLLGFVFLLFLCAGYGLYQYFRPSVGIGNVEPDIFISASDLKKQMAGDTDAKNKFNNAVILVEGEISSLEEGSETTFFIGSSVRCELDKDSRLPQAQERVKVKGLFAGYDELFEEVLLVKCEIERIDGKN